MQTLSHGENYNLFRRLGPRDALDELIVYRFAGLEADAEELLRDPYSHFKHLHAPEDRRYSFVEGGFSNILDRCGHEYLLGVQCGNYVYDSDNYSGSLNH